VNVWSHVACTYDGAMVRIFHNGQQLNSAASTGALLAGDGNGIAIGGNSPSGDPLLGDVDELRIWKIARTPAQICADYGLDGC
jgi:hypothetical protein